MANARIDRKGFLKSLGVAAAACVARPAGAATVRMGTTLAEGAKTASVELPRKTRAAARIVAFRAPGV